MEPTRSLEPTAGDALIIADVQNDFLPGGTLPVAQGRDVIEPLNRCIETFARRHLPIYASRDWHPSDHCSFRLRGGPWPPHCIAGLRGAEPPTQLHLPDDAHLVLKATRPNADAYSAFQATGLAVALRKGGCRRVFIGGLTTDYCVRETALDALSAGFEVVVLEDAVRAINAHPGDGQRALAQMSARGAVLASTSSVTARSRA